MFESFLYVQEYMTNYQYRLFKVTLVCHNFIMPACVSDKAVLGTLALFDHVKLKCDNNYTYKNNRDLK